jgi:two-component system, chemotaxis family, chemotaxis protein CheY
MHSILAVDDSASMRQMVTFTLKNAGFNVVEAVDGQDALDKTHGREFNLVLTDQNMPRMDGISLTKKLRENPRFKTTPILILTTESSDQMKQAGRSAGATGWLVKPFDPAKLVEVIGKVIR